MSAFKETEYQYLESELQTSSKLVLLIDHQENGKCNKVDLRFFCIYDPNIAMYMLYGRRFTRNKKVDSPPFYFEFSRLKDLLSFVTETIGYNEKFGITLYNYNNLIDIQPARFSFEFFEELMDPLYEIAGYDRCKFHDCYVLKKFLKFLRKTATF